jgi:hypothetical protein
MYIRIQLLITILLTSIANAAALADPTQVVVRVDSGQVASVTVPPVTPGAAAGAAAGANACNCRDKDLLPFQKGLVLLPVVLALLLFLFVYRVLKQGGYSLADALSENDTRVAAVAAANAPNPPGQPANNAQQVQGAQTAQTVPGNRSASRLVLFLSGITAIVISVCITTYYLYFYLCCGKAPELDGLISVLLTLGIGVIPYTVNKVTQPDPASR